MLHKSLWEVIHRFYDSHTSYAFLYHVIHNSFVESWNCMLKFKSLTWSLLSWVGPFATQGKFIFYLSITFKFSRELQIYIVLFQTHLNYIVLSIDGVFQLFLSREIYVIVLGKENCWVLDEPSWVWDGLGFDKIFLNTWPHMAWNINKFVFLRNWWYHIILHSSSLCSRMNKLPLIVVLSNDYNYYVGFKFKGLFS